MADYPISKEAVARELINLRDALGGPFVKEVLNMALARLEGFPQMDAVPVVRCRECNNTKWWPTPKDTIFCDKWGEWMPCNGFCHMGKKMAGGAEG